MNGVADFHHVEFRVSNALQTSYWYCCCFGFQRFATNYCESSTCIAIRNGPVIFVIKSIRSSNREDLKQITVHGDAVKDVAYRVDSIDAIHERLVENDISILSPKTTYQDEHGSVNILQIQATDSDITHSLIEDKNYSGVFLPGYSPADDYPISSLLTKIPVVFLDHVVQNYPINTIENAAEWYRQSMAMQRFWSIDDKVTTSEFSAMKAWLIANQDRKVQMTLAEPVCGRKGRSQIDEFVSYNGGSGIQHIALLVDDIVANVTEMRKRSVEFLEVPSSYYDMLEERLQESKVELKEDIKKALVSKLLRELCILMDFDDNGYLLQLFTKPVQDRPTLFLEIIQRRNFNGFGAGNFKALFDAVEREQKRRGTLFEEA
ncbi:4-hydroxyphenylpyruvate dioxygenase [Dictyocaulus viviparus]|uniref:4-hydroxyphenylpyruvate dioxygenase n=1 Tax=Dictyocaulus viviparus TaxID=29172 RepID=A0A0D8XZA0_DICVI|nr:4-hydroxyphenylpyruvate dioxygenase [Dictyocaulus viviparus]